MREDWIEIELKDACGIHDNLRKPINTKERNERIKGKEGSELYPYFGATGQVGYIDDYLTDGEYVLIGEDGAPFLDYTKNVAYLIKGKTWVNNHAHILLSHFDNKFLLHYLNQFSYKGFVSGTTRLKLTQGALKRIPVKLAPLPEQRAIVSKIEQLFSELDNGIANLKAAKEKLEIYRQAVLKKAFEGELTKEWRKHQTDLPTADELLEQIKKERIKHYENQLTEWKKNVAKWETKGKQGKKPSKPKKVKEPDVVDQSELTEFESLPKQWTWARLSNVVIDSANDIVDGPFGSNLKSSEYVNEGYPILRIQNIKANSFIEKNIKFVTEEKYHSLKRHQFLPNDLVITKLGDPLGLACRVPKDFQPGIIVADLIRLRPSSSNIDYNWLTLLINCHIVQTQFRKITKGTTRPRMNLTIMRNVYLPICSKAEQAQIVQEIESRLSVCDNILTNIEESLEKCEALRQSILKQAFEGKLLSEAELETCKVAPDWEPAEQLITKIREL